MSTDPKLNAAALRPLYEALKECLMAVPLHWTETRASAYAALILAESPAEQPPSGLMQMHGEVDEYGQGEVVYKIALAPSGTGWWILWQRDLGRVGRDKWYAAYVRENLLAIIALLPEEHR